MSLNVENITFTRNTKNVERLARGGVMKLSELVIKQIEHSIARGHYPEAACAGAGIRYNTFKSWMISGRQDYGRITTLQEQGVKLYKKDMSMVCKLYIAVQRALYQSQDTPLRAITAAAEAGDWRAAAHFLERRFHQQWGRKSEQRIEQVGETQVQTVIVVPEKIHTADEWNDKVAEQVKLNNPHNSNIDSDSDGDMDADIDSDKDTGLTPYGRGY